MRRADRALKKIKKKSAAKHNDHSIELGFHDVLFGGHLVAVLMREERDTRVGLPTIRLEEAYRNDSGGVIAQERFPALRPQSPGPDHISSDRPRWSMNCTKPTTKSLCSACSASSPGTGC
jgi:hypothetical protein